MLTASHTGLPATSYNHASRADPYDFAHYTASMEKANKQVVTVIGVDCATQPEKVGLAVGAWCGGQLKLQHVVRGRRRQIIAEAICEWIKDSERTLLALDAPLGWPMEMGQSLAGHQAGYPLVPEPSRMFRRETDRFVERNLGKRPLEVGANFIARTAHAALRLLEGVRAKTGEAIPLAWSHHELASLSAIEVYPAATRMVHRIVVEKDLGPADERLQIMDGLSGILTLPEDTGAMRSNRDALDAALCVLAGADFLSGHAMPPQEKELATKEGWIWVRDPNHEAAVKEFQS